MTTLSCKAAVGLDTGVKSFGFNGVREVMVWISTNFLNSSSTRSKMS